NILFIRRLINMFKMSSKKESFLLVSLNESKAKELAQVVTNDTCRKILNYLADNEATESEIAKELSLPISTVHYNLQQLIKGSLVIVDEFHYSEKGKEVNHYKLANKFIIIAPKSTWGLKEKLKKVLPITAIVVVASFAVQFAYSIFGKAGKSAVFASEMAMDSVKTVGDAGDMVASAAPQAGDLVSSSASRVGEVVANKAAETAGSTGSEVVRTMADYTVSTPAWQYIGLWFLIGGLFAILTYLFVDWMRNK
ncbi:ArsR/SmtB family transcription factor, partial [Bacteroidota bacterium]